MPIQGTGTERKLLILILVEIGTAAIWWLRGGREQPSPIGAEPVFLQPVPADGRGDWNLYALNPLSTAAGVPRIDEPQQQVSILGGIVTAEEVVRRQGIRVARAVLHRVLGTLFAVVDSVAAGQVASSINFADGEAFEG